MKPHIAIVAAARPNFMKIAPITRALSQASDEFEFTLIHTGQHYDKNMSETFFEQLEIPKPGINLEIGGGTHAEQTGQTMMAFEKFLLENKIDMVLVAGDVNATVACALTAKKLTILVGHIEAGLRSFDRTMPEEINRLATDAISDYFYTPSPDANAQLQKEAVPEDRIVYIGNIMIDTLMHQKAKADEEAYFRQLGLSKEGYIPLTMHRPSNVDDPVIFERILKTLQRIAEDYPIVWPLHPRSRKNLEKFGLESYVKTGPISGPGLYILEPLGYREMVSLVSNAKLIITDSGGIQEETTALQVPCITIRENTERPITITEGSNILAGSDPEKIMAAYTQICENPKPSKVPEKWDGKAAERILDHLRTVPFKLHAEVAL